MLEINKEYTVEISAVSSDGNGVGHIDGFAVFVPRTAVGDTVRVRAKKIKPRFAICEPLEIISPSADRIESDCAVFERCGGCQLRHMSYEAELPAKRAAVESAMQRIGGFKGFELDGITGMDTPKRYRNKMIFHISPSAHGFYAAKSHEIIPIDDCKIGIEENGKILDAISGDAINQIFVRKAFATGEIMVVLSADKPIGNEIIEKLKEINGISSIISDINGRKTVLWGRERIEEILCGIKFEICADSFFQVNPVQTEKLYNKALEFASLTGNETVMDVYCGAGTISLCAAKSAKKVIGVEIVGRAVEDARKNAIINGIENAEFFADSAENIVPKLIDGGSMPDVVILDPPRAGSDERTLGAIVKASPEKIVYVSCNPATLARDAKFLAERGYTPISAYAFDLFPRTMHIETVCKFIKNKS